MTGSTLPGGGGDLRWLVRVDPPLTGAENMAWDHTLARELPGGAAVLRLYTWLRPTLSFGRNEPATGVYSPGRIDDAGFDVVRRPTGGRAVLHHRELTYSVAAPIRPFGGVRAAYGLINRALAVGLATLVREFEGAPVPGTIGLAGPRKPARPDAGPCFRAPAEGEVMALGRKLVGSAQVKIGEALLQHGSILLEDDQLLIPPLRDGGVWKATTQGTLEDGAATRGGAAAGDANRPAALSEVAGRSVSLEEVREAVVTAFREVVPGDWRPHPGGDRFDAHGLPTTPDDDLLEQYSSDAWTWRR